MTPYELTTELKRRNLSDTEAGERIGVDRTTVWRWRNWRMAITPQADKAIRFALREYDEGKTG